MPDLDEVASLHWSHFTELQSERPMGGMGGAGPIPESRIYDYAIRHGFGGEGYLNFHRIMRFLDNRWLKMVSDKQEKESKKSKAKSRKR
jgi:hypothetical protein